MKYIHKVEIMEKHSMACLDRPASSPLKMFLKPQLKSITT